MAYQGNSPNLFIHKKLDQIVFDGTSVSYPLTANGNLIYPTVAEAILISLNGIIQESQDAYSISGSTITFSEPPPINTDFFGVSLGESVRLADVLPASGGTMTGFITLIGNPATNLHAVPKQYVDQTIAAGDFVSRSGAQTLTNKVLTAPVITEDVVVISTNTTTVRSKTYIVTANLTATLPLNPSAGWKVSFVNMSSTNSFVVARNGQNLMSLNEDMTVDVKTSFDLIFVDSARGWVIA